MTRVGCATCGEPPIGSFNDGSPRWAPDHIHPPIYGTGAPAERVVIELDEGEMAEADACGKKRLTRAKARRARDQLGEPSLVSHMIGAQGERAFSKWIGEPWECTTGRYGGASDVKGCQIRTVSKTGGRVVVHESDPDRIPVVSIVAHGSRFWLRGWIFAREAKLREYVGDPGNRRPAFFFPPFELRPMADLTRLDPARAALGLPPMAAL
jgi:hypothetical protein